MRHRLAVILPIYCALFCACYAAAYLVRFDFSVPADYVGVLTWTLPIVLLVKLSWCALLGEWRRTYRHVSVADLAPLAAGAAASYITVMLLNAGVVPGAPIPRSVILIDFIVSLVAFGCLRVAYRAYAELMRPRVATHHRENALIYGVAQPSVAILRMLQATATLNHPFRPCGFVDPQPRPQQSRIGGLPVLPLPPAAAWDDLRRRTGAAHLLIPGGIPGRTVRELLRACTTHGMRVHVIPMVDDLVDGRFTLGVRDVQVNDLLRREPNQLDVEALRESLAGQCVLVTGGAGSIGSEICRQLLALGPGRLVVLDQSEFGMFTLERELAARPPEGTDLCFVVGDVLDGTLLRRVFLEHRPEYVFHAAAYKHVPLMEQNPQAALHNNVLGTRAVADAAHEFGAGRFVLISTDKAVRPSSVMGATKLLAEKYIQGLACRSETSFLTVRFGNVLNSLGSVVPTFRRQIRAGGPITVTHPEMRRFFMTIPEAVQLVLQASRVGESGQVLILDMGEPVRIVDLARDMILLSGLRCPEDIEIVFTGVRPGEKLTEELFYPHEAGARRIHEKIFCSSETSPAPLVQVLADLTRLQAAGAEGPDRLKRELHAVAAYYGDSTPQPVETARAA